MNYLGALADQIPLLWLAAPLTGLLIQPIIGQASDRTWSPLGRRRSYFLAGAVLSTLMLVLLLNAGSLLMAAFMLWVLDASINISMEPSAPSLQICCPKASAPAASRCRVSSSDSVRSSPRPILTAQRDGSRHFDLNVEPEGAVTAPT